MAAVLKDALPNATHLVLAFDARDCRALERIEPLPLGHNPYPRF
jgi:hypothetical protein